MFKNRHFLILFFLLFPSLCFANFSGRIVRVVDGDTVQILTEGIMVKVRLSGIYAPESGQPFGKRSKQNLIDLAAQKQADVIANDKDRYGRWLGTLMINGKNINAEQVKSGMAWAYRYHGRAHDVRFLKLEEKARQCKIGLWSSNKPIEPWKWRKQKFSDNLD